MVIRKKIEYFNEGLTVGKGNSGISAIYIFIFLSILVFWETFERRMPLYLVNMKTKFYFYQFHDEFNQKQG